MWQTDLHQEVHPRSQGVAVPLFMYECAGCGKKTKRLVKSYSTEKLTCGCGGSLDRKLPESVSAVTKELKDPYRGVSQTKGLQQQLKKRMTQHSEKHDLERQIDEYGVDDARKFGWDRRVKRT